MMDNEIEIPKGESSRNRDSIIIIILKLLKKTALSGRM